MIQAYVLYFDKYEGQVYEERDFRRLDSAITWLNEANREIKLDFNKEIIESGIKENEKIQSIH